MFTPPVLKKIYFSLLLLFFSLFYRFFSSLWKSSLPPCFRQAQQAQSSITDKPNPPSHCWPKLSPHPFRPNSKPDTTTKNPLPKTNKRDKLTPRTNRKSRLAHRNSRLTATLNPKPTETQDWHHHWKPMAAETQAHLSLLLHMLTERNEKKNWCVLQTWKLQWGSKWEESELKKNKKGWEEVHVV